MPPETPQSTKPIPLAFNIFACSMSSVKRELPPSMTRSPLSSRSPSLEMVSWVAGPAGTITHTVRGASSALTMAAMVRTSETLGSRSKPTTSWPARRRRSRMLPPIFPRPMRPSCMADPFETSVRRAPGDETATTNRPLIKTCRVVRQRGLRGQATATARIRKGVRPSGAAGETHRHEDVAVAVVGVALRLGLSGEDRGPARLGERQSRVGRAEGAQPVEQEMRVEGDLDVGTGEGRLDRLGGLGIVAGAGLDGDLAVGELQAYRGVALRDQGDAANGLDQRRRLDDRLGVDAGRKDRGDLGVLAVEESGRRAPLTGLEPDQPVAA